MDPNQNAGRENLVALVKTLEHAAAVLAQSVIVNDAVTEFDAAVVPATRNRRWRPRSA